MSQTEIVSEFSLLDGKLKCQYYNSGEAIGEAVGYYDNGRLRFKYPLLKGDISGIGRVWSDDGMLLGEEAFHAGLRHGRRKEWHPNGALKLEARYVANLLEGEYKEWFENGKYKQQREYQQGLIHGVCLEWYPNGQLKTRAAYRFNRMHGIYKAWNETGALLDKSIFVRGVRMSGDLGERIEKGKLTAKLILRTANTAVRRICLEEFGYARFLAELPHQILDRSGEYELVKIDWHKREEPICLVKVKCPSTGAFYTLRVPTTMKTVKEAVAWTFDVNAGEYLPEVET